MELNEKKRRKSIKVWVSDEERKLVEAKAEFYGYTRLAKYVRDAVIYENVTNMNIVGKEEILNAYAENTKYLKMVLKEIRHISKYATQIDEYKRKEIVNLMFGMFKNQKTMLNVIEEKLDLDVYKEINHRKLGD